MAPPFSSGLRPAPGDGQLPSRTSRAAHGASCMCSSLTYSVYKILMSIFLVTGCILVTGNRTDRMLALMELPFSEGNRQ